MNYKQVIIFGHGRSGTNWLSRVLDYSAFTHCRIDPNKLAGNPLSRLPFPPWIVGTKDRFLKTEWDNAVHWTHLHFGERDWLLTNKKTFLRPLSQRLGLYRLYAGKRYRKFLSFVLPGYRLPEYSIPGFVVERKKLAGSLLVIKINQAPEWAAWVLNNCPETCVIQIVRHPGGVLNSWKNRYLSGEDHDLVLESNRNRLKMIAETDKEWADLFGDIGLIGLDESELWFWRYSTEMVHRIGKSNESYILCNFENMAEHPAKIAKEIYLQVGLEWDQRVDECIEKESASSTLIASKWRKSLSNDEVKVVEKILAGSDMQHWWND